MTFGMYGMLFLVPLYLQSLLHLTGTAAGLVLLPLGLVFAVVSLFAGRLANRSAQRAWSASAWRSRHSAWGRPRWSHPRAASGC